MLLASCLVTPNQRQSTICARRVSGRGTLNVRERVAMHRATTTRRWSLQWTKSWCIQKYKVQFENRASATAQLRAHCTFHIFVKPRHSTNREWVTIAPHHLFLSLSWLPSLEAKGKEKKASHLSPFGPSASSASAAHVTKKRAYAPDFRRFEVEDFRLPHLLKTDSSRLFKCRLNNDTLYFSFSGCSF